MNLELFLRHGKQRQDCLLTWELTRLYRPMKRKVASLAVLLGDPAKPAACTMACRLLSLSALQSNEPPPLCQHSDILVLRMPMTYGLNSS
jgi:hypothetical protein